MRKSTMQVILTASILIFSSLAGCLGTEDEDEPYIMTSTYHVGQLVSAIVGDTMNVEVLAPSNVPVHDFEPSATDLVRLKDAEMFFYHGLGLETWVDSTLDSLGDDKPTSFSTHALPTGETALDYEGILLRELCEHLAEGPYEAANLSDEEGHADDVELHAEHVTHTLSFPAHDDHDDDAGDNHDNHSAHDDHDGHNHAEPMEKMEDVAGCPEDTVVYIYELEEGEYVLEFETEDENHSTFDMVALKMGGAHHHHHDHGDDHDDHGDDHDDHGDDHSDHDHGDNHSDHDDHGDDHDEHEDGVGYAVIHIEAEGEYGFAIPHDVEMFILSEGDGHDDHSDHDDHGDEEALAYDPHSWLDPVAFKAQASFVLEELKKAYPDLADTFQSNADAFMMSLDKIDTEYKAAFGDGGTCAKNSVAANHNAYAYIAYRYDIEFVTVHGLDPEGEPSAADITKVVEKIGEDEISVLFVEEYTDVTAVNSIVDQTKSSTMPDGVSVLTLYTMELPPKDSNDDYLSLMQKNLDNLKTGLSC